jgi:hypothetical protein
MRIKFYIITFLYFCLLPILAFSQERQPGDEIMPSYASESVLNSGTWFKFGITENGIYKLDKVFFSSLGLDPQTIDPNRLRIYFNGNGPLPEANSKLRPDDLIENNILVSGGGDGQFNDADYVLFYGMGPTRWKFNVLSSKFEHEINPYSDTTWYFVCIDKAGSGKRIADKAQSSLEANHFYNQFFDYQYHESDSVNLMLSGRQWYGEEFSVTTPVRSFDFPFPDLVKNRNVYVRVEFVGRSIAEDMKYGLEANGNILFDSINLAKLSADSQIHARENNKATEFQSDTDNIRFSIGLLATDGSSRAWLNYLRVNAWRYLRYNNKPLLFRNPQSVSGNAVSSFSLAGAQNDLMLWDITLPLQAKNQAFTKDGDSLRFTVETDSLREYILFNPNQAISIQNAYPIENQNLHAISSTEMLIISHHKFIDQANLIKEIHYNDDGLDCLIVDVDDIYNEFGCGVHDVTALRDFIRMLYFKSNYNLKYLLLLGDASYDYRNRIDDNTNYVPTYQATNSLIETKSYLSDDYFGLMDEAEGADMSGSLDLGIGRLPVGSIDDAMILIDKIQNYIADNDDNTGSWRNSICIFADDGNDNLHLNQAETLSAQIDTARFEMNVSKVYIDAFKRQSTAGGFRFPDANISLINKINDGALIINYTGHGGINGLTDEKVFTVSDITSLNNQLKMSFFITATCEFSRFDNPHFVSAGEKLLLQPTGGAIAMMTTTRVAFSHSNFALNRKLYEAIFSRNDVQPKRLGDIIRNAKNPANENINNFTLLGDPALRLNYPSKKVVTTLFNGKSPETVADTIHAMSEINIKGDITDFEGVKVINFNGYLEVKMFDKRTTYRTLGNDGTSNAVNFNYFDKILYKGRVSVKNGSFESHFLLPRDISFQYGPVKISYYAYDTTTFDDATGVYGNLILGGTDETVSVDETGPEIEMYMNNSDFQSGDAMLSNPVLYANITDPQGISFLGSSIGRDIVLTMNDQTNASVNLNNYFIPDTDSFTSGSLSYPFYNLETGTYTLTVKAWDQHNNSTEKSIAFVVETRNRLTLTEVKNTPNPFRNETSFSFHHNQEDGLFGVKINIFAIDGRLINVLEGSVETADSESVPLIWNGRDFEGRKIHPGTYVYEITITDKSGRQSTVQQKLIFIR